MPEDRLEIAAANWSILEDARERERIKESYNYHDGAEKNGKWYLQG